MVLFVGISRVPERVKGEEIVGNTALYMCMCMCSCTGLEWLAQPSLNLFFTTTSGVKRYRGVVVLDESIFCFLMIFLSTSRTVCSRKGVVPLIFSFGENHEAPLSSHLACAMGRDDRSLGALEEAWEILS